MNYLTSGGEHTFPAKIEGQQRFGKMDKRESRPSPCSSVITDITRGSRDKLSYESHVFIVSQEPFSNLTTNYNKHAY